MPALSNDAIRRLLEPYVAPFRTIDLSDSLDQASFGFTWIS